MVNIRGLLAVALAAAILASCGPKIDGLAKGETGRAAKVRDGDTFELDNGLVVHLAGVEAPRSSEPQAADARAALERLVGKRKVQLAYGGQKRVREAAVAHVFAQTEGGRWIWVQQALLQAGMVRVHTRRENIARAGEMLAAEAAARKQHKGIWGDPHFSVVRASSLSRSADEIAANPACAEESAAQSAAADAPPPHATDKAEADGPRRPRRARDFMIVEGRVANVAVRERATFLNFGGEIDRDFAILVPKDAADAWPGGEAALQGMSGRSIRVRGEVPRCAKPLMRVDHPQQIEALDAPAPHK